MGYERGGGEGKGGHGRWEVKILEDPGEGEKEFGLNLIKIHYIYIYEIVDE